MPKGRKLLAVVVIAMVVVTAIAIALILMQGSSGASTPEEALTKYYQALNDKNINQAMKYSIATFADSSNQDGAKRGWNELFADDYHYVLTNIKKASESLVELRFYNATGVSRTYAEIVEHVKSYLNGIGVNAVISEVQFLEFHVDYTYDGGSNSEHWIDIVMQINGRWYWSSTF
jgi:hypothetical protein